MTLFTVLLITAAVLLTFAVTVGIIELLRPEK
jgi:hypothetical protein